MSITGRWLLAGAVSSLAVALIVFLMPHAAAQRPTDAAATIALTSAAAVAVERVIEGIWTILGSSLGEWWPLSVINDQVASLTNGLTATMNQFYSDARAALDVAAQADARLSTAVEAAKAQLDADRAALTTDMDQLRRLAPNNQTVNLLAARALQAASVADTRYRPIAAGMENVFSVANQSITGVGDFLATIHENPAKRLISLWLGVILGMGASGVLGLNVFAAVIGQAPIASTQATSTDAIAIVLTGIVIGLGSSPTHEVISVLQEVKKARKADNTATPGTTTN